MLWTSTETVGYKIDWQLQRLSPLKRSCSLMPFNVHSIYDSNSGCSVEGADLEAGASKAAGTAEGGAVGEGAGDRQALSAILDLSYRLEKWLLCQVLRYIPLMACYSFLSGLCLFD